MAQRLPPDVTHHVALLPIIPNRRPDNFYFASCYDMYNQQLSAPFDTPGKNTIVLRVDDYAVLRTGYHAKAGGPTVDYGLQGRITSFESQQY